MALSIGVSVGSRISVGDAAFVEVKHVTQDVIVIALQGADFPVPQKDVVITDHQRTEILPDVFVQVGVGERGQSGRLAFEAPRHIRISRQQEKRRAS